MDMDGKFHIHGKPESTGTTFVAIGNPSGPSRSNKNISQNNTRNSRTLFYTEFRSSADNVFNNVNVLFLVEKLHLNLFCTRKANCVVQRMKNTMILCTKIVTFEILFLSTAGFFVD